MRRFAYCITIKDKTGAETLITCKANSRRPLFAMGTQVIGAISNTILDALFIWRWGWGIAGAAWGTILSQMLSVLWVSSFYWRYGGRDGA